MIEMFSATLKEAAKETSKEGGGLGKEIVPRFFDVMPKSEKTDNMDDFVRANGVGGAKGDGVVHLITRNENLEGGSHPATGVPFERKHIDGTVNLEGVFPIFDREFDAHIPTELYEESDRTQFSACNRQLKVAIGGDPSLEKSFTKSQLEQIKNGDTPDGYVWHHDAELGKIQLVDFETHANTGHTGGRTVWGGGNESR